MGGIKKIYILHGWSYSAEKWEPFIKDLRSRGFDPELLKIPGLTDSIDRAFTLDDYVEWLFRKTEKEKKYILVGHSNGGRISLAFTAKYPEKVKKLVLIDSAGIYHRELSLQIKRFIFKNIARLKHIYSSNGAKKLLYKLAGEQDYNSTTSVMKETMKNLIEVDLVPVLSSVSVPTLVVWGAHDTTTPIADAEVFHRGIKNSKIEIINEARHSPQFSHREEVVKSIYEYLKQ